MSTDRDTTRIVRSWLRMDEYESADRVLDAVLDRLDTTPQRRATWWPARRLSDMNTFMKLVAAVAAVAIVTVVGIGLLPGGPELGNTPPEPSPTAIPTPTATPAPTPHPTFPPAGALPVGSHSIPIEAGRLTIDIEMPGWVSNGEFGIDKGQMDASDSAGFIFWTSATPDNVYADPCAMTPLDPPAGPSVAELAAAVASIPGTELVSGPSEVTVGGYPAQHVAIRIPDDIGCSANSFHLWYARSASGQSRYASELGSTINTWIVDVDGSLVWIDGETYASSGPEATDEIMQIVNSIRFRLSQGPG
jgi:hypothetical protein